MRAVIKVLFLLCALWMCAESELKADFTIEMQTTVSGIPFFKSVEIYQTYYLRQGEFYGVSEFKIAVTDTAMTLRTGIFLNLNKKQMAICDYQDSTCSVLDLSSLDSLIGSGLSSANMDSLRFFIDSVAKFITIKRLNFGLTDNRQTISNYGCREIIYDLEGSLSLPIKEMPGDLRFRVNGSSWVTNEFPKSSEYVRIIKDLKGLFFTPRLQQFIGDVLEQFKLDRTLAQQFLDLWEYMYVQTKLNFSVEVWSPQMTMPSMTFNLLCNSVLLDLSFDKIPDKIFQIPAGFTTKKLNSLKDLEGSRKF